MKSRNLLGGALVGALLLGLWLGQFWKGPGLGGSGNSDQTDTDQGDPDQSAQVRSDYTSVDLGPDHPAPGKKSPELLTIVVHDDRYRLTDADLPASGKDVTLDEIRQRVAGVPGTPEGIRVRVLKEKSAQEGARSDLLAALTAAGVKREEIQERADFVD